MHMNHKQKIRFFQLAQLAIMKMPMADFMELTGTAVGNVAQEKIKMICKCQNEIETETSLLAYEKEETV